MQTRLGLRVLGEQVPSPRERVGGRLVAGEEDGHRLVAQLLVGHARAVALVVLRVEEHGEEVAAVFAGRAPLLDDAVDDGVEPRARPLEAAVGGQRQAAEELRERHHEPRERGHRSRERLAHLLGLGLGLRTEERAADDGQRQVHHLLRRVERAAVPPALALHPQRVIDHQRTVGIDALLVKGGLRQPPLAPVERRLARQKPLAQQALRALEPAPLHEARVVRDEHVPDVVGVVEQVEVLRHAAEVSHVAVLARHADRKPSGSRVNERNDNRARTPSAPAGRLGSHGDSAYACQLSDTQKDNHGDTGHLKGLSKAYLCVNCTSP